MHPFQFSRRYLFSRKSRNAIHFITLITALGFTVCTASMIIILSALNGFVSLVVALYSTFDADIKITPKNGKVFHAADERFRNIRSLEGIAFYNEILEENVLLKYDDKQTIATVKAVSNGYVETMRLDTMVRQGNMIIHDTVSFCSVGSGVAAKLDVNVTDEFAPVEIYVPRREQFDPLNPENSFNNKPAYPTAVFAVQQEIDDKYILTSLRFARELLDYQDEVSAIEISLKPGINSATVIDKIKTQTGDDFIIQNRTQQHASLYKLMNIEKWVAFLILAFVLLIVSFNLVGSLLMMVIEKKKDFSILYALGMPVHKIKNIILGEGLLIAGIGSATGIAMGVLLCLLQESFGFVKLGGEGSTFVVDTYPIQLQLSDVILTFFVSLFIGWLASIYPSLMSKKVEVTKAE